MEKEFEVILKPTDALESELAEVFGGATGNCTDNHCSDNSGSCTVNHCNKNEEDCGKNYCITNLKPCTGKVAGSPTEGN